MTERPVAIASGRELDSEPVRALTIFALTSTVALASSCESTPASARPGTPFTVWVFEERVSIDGEDRPLANVRVAFDPPGGKERVTKTTEGDGHATFEGDFANGGASVTVLSDEHVYVTMLEASPETAGLRPNTIGKPASDLVVFASPLDRLAEGRTVELRGTIVGKQDPDNVVSLAASSVARLGGYQALESTYVLRAPKDRPFFLLGHETRTLVDDDQVVVLNQLLKSFRIDLPARAEDQLLDLDLSKLPALPVTTLHVRAVPPAGGPFVPGGRAFASIGSADSSLSVGVFAEARPTPDGSGFEIDVARVDTNVDPERLVSRAVVVAPDGSQSVRGEPGPMADGTVWNDFALPPSIPDPERWRFVTDEIPLDGFPKGADLLAKVYGGGKLLWILHGPPGGPRASSFTIPYRGEVKNAFVSLFALSLTAQRDRVMLPSRGELYRYTSTFRDVILNKK